MSWLKLFDYQFDAVSRMKNGCILNGGVGSGKSRTSLAYYYKENGGNLYSEDYSKMSNPRDLYIITTARKRDTAEWDKELAVFLMSTNSSVNLYSNKIVIDSWNNIQKYVNVYNAFFIFDEDKVTGSGVWVKTFLKLAKKNKWIILSATPGDCWKDYIPVFIANGFYKHKTEFLTEHVIFSHYTSYPKIDRYVGTKKLERLRDSILIDMVFERKTVPTHCDIFCDYDIQKYKNAIRTRWNPEKEKPFETANELCLYLRKIVNSDESRQIEVLKILEKHPKAIIFYTFDYELDILRNLGYMPNTKIAEWNGHLHQEIPNSKKWVYLVQYNSGCEGWNCIKTDTIIFYSQNYSYKVLQQACGRIDRLNTPYTYLYYYHLRSRSGIDLAITRALNQKKLFNEKKFLKWE